jgi:signal recognition particle subunit SRP54
MLDQLTDRLARIVKQVRGEARLTEANTQEMLREVRLALLEADVALPVVRDFVARVREDAMGQEVVGSLTPGQALVGVVHRQLARLMGSDLPPKEREINLATQPPAVILLAGLQGAGKTTTTGKLGRWLAAEKRRKVLAVSTDVYRPAAIAQLETVCGQAGIEFFPTPPQADPVAIAREAVAHARRRMLDVVLIDTAGRTSVDEAMMDEIARLHAAVQPIETLFVVDAMLGQDAVQTATAFGARLPLTGVIVTKLDGDARGGAALSVTQLTGKPIKFAGTGEKLNGLEPFDAERMAGRVLGMGDIVALVEEVKSTVDLGAAQKLAQRMQSGARFDLNDFREQIAQMRRMGGLGGLMDKLPSQLTQAAGKVDPRDAERQIRRMEGILNSMTPGERAKPEIIKAARKRRIAAGAGVAVQDVNRMLTQFDQMSAMMKQMRKGGLGKMMRALGSMGGMGMPGGGGFRRH